MARDCFCFLGFWCLLLVRFSCLISLFGIPQLPVPSPPGYLRWTVLLERIDHAAGTATVRLLLLLRPNVNVPPHRILHVDVLVGNVTDNPVALY